MNSKLIQKIKYNKLVVKLYAYMMNRIQKENVPIDVPEVRALQYRKLNKVMPRKRLNLLIPSLNPKNVFGGIATALSFYQQLAAALQCDCRIIVVDDEIDVNHLVELNGYEVVKCTEESLSPKQLVDMGIRTNKALMVGDKDVFMATGWWTAYMIEPVVKWQSEQFTQETKPLLYFIQDYEPGFYAWSSRYLMAESTYKMDIDVMAVFNSKLLHDFFVQQGYEFYQKWYFEPVLNEKLRLYLEQVQTMPSRKKQILLYGRPKTARNAFELIVESLREWIKIQEDAKEWRILSAGEEFSDITLAEGIKIESVGKLTLEEYAQVMLETKVGISLMVSPHPSYPPLEMSTFGVKVITNTYNNKNLHNFNENIVSIDNCSASSIAFKLHELCCDSQLENQPQLCGDYVNARNQWDLIIADMVKIYSHEMEKNCR